MTDPAHRSANRRTFLTGAGVATVASTVAVHTSTAQQPGISPSETVRIGLVGAGGRGSGAAVDTLTINDGVALAAIADLNADKPAGLTKALSRKFEAKVKTGEKLYSGLDAYKRILDDDEIDIVMFATPPGFRPGHILEAVDAGKHVFAEKPTCIDPAGYKLCLQAHAKAIDNKTAIVTGTQYRRQTNYIE